MSRGTQDSMCVIGSSSLEFLSVENLFSIPRILLWRFLSDDFPKIILVFLQKRFHKPMQCVVVGSRALWEEGEEEEEASQGAESQFQVEEIF